MHAAVYLRRELAWRKSRGVPFDEAWEESIERTCATRSAEADWWREEFQCEREVWRRAYEDEAALPREAAFVDLLTLPDSIVQLVEIPFSVEQPDRVCAHCAGDMGHAGPQARYCSRRCRRDASYLRERSKVGKTVNFTAAVRRGSEIGVGTPAGRVGALAA